MSKCDICGWEPQAITGYETFRFTYGIGIDPLPEVTISVCRMCRTQIQHRTARTVEELKREAVGVK